MDQRQAGTGDRRRSAARATRVGDGLGVTPHHHRSTRNAGAFSRTTAGVRWEIDRGMTRLCRPQLANPSTGRTQRVVVSMHKASDIAPTGHDRSKRAESVTQRVLWCCSSSYMYPHWGWQHHNARITPRQVTRGCPTGIIDAQSLSH